MNRVFWIGKRVFVTGHTGFKGGWLSLWLGSLGAKVCGFSLWDHHPNGIYNKGEAAKSLGAEIFGDIRDFSELQKGIESWRPEIVFHLAAQALVRRSYRDPLETISTNVSGTANVSEAARNCHSCKTIVVVTSDKCYENSGKDIPFKEYDPMGGHDPYSASKGCTELICSSFRRSFLAERGIGLATARAGNVIGGGDESEDRLVPDFLRASDKQHPLLIRYPGAIRPWQHVLEALSGYLHLAERLHEEPFKFGESWNFGPREKDCKTVSWVVDHLASLLPGSQWKTQGDEEPHEAGCLKLDISKACEQLGWIPRWDVLRALEEVVEWHRGRLSGCDMRNLSLGQIDTYLESIDN